MVQAAHLHDSQRAGAQEGVLGMSGSVKGITILFAAFFPNAVLLLVPAISHRSSPSSPPWPSPPPTNKQFGVLRLRAPIAVGTLIAADLLLALLVPQSGISHAGHLGGAPCGLLYALSLPRRR
jgi:membrane associated rhomboid family serine protease